MKLWGRCAAIAAAVTLLAAENHALRADQVLIPNGNFAADDASAQLEFAFPSPLTAWQGGSPATTGVFYNSPTITVETSAGPPPVFSPYPNPLYVTNLASTQAAYLYAVPGVELHQALTATYQVGQSYHLQFGLIASDGSVPFVGAVASGATIELLLYYGSNPANVVGSTTATNIGTTIATQTYLDMSYAVDVPAVQAGSPWANQPIGIQMIIPGNSPANGGIWDVGNLDLTSAAPEPTSLALLGVGLLVLTAQRRRAVAA